jgi:serine/threonine protein phosphatase PrpC
LNYLTAVHTDVGLKKTTNQDSICLNIADTSIGKVAFAVLCDGMGGLSKGELASATLIRAFKKWFCTELPLIIESGCDLNIVRNNWSNIITEQNNRISNYGKTIGASLGTTLTVLLIINDTYLIANVGDSRAYELNENIIQITKDHTVVEREIERGRLTLEEAEKDSRRNVLLQCIGASSVVVPDFFEGKVITGSAFLLCTDGFRHEVSTKEIYDSLTPKHLLYEGDIEAKIRKLIDLIKVRKEQDNITAAIIKITA